MSEHFIHYDKKERGMNKQIIAVFFLVFAAAAGYYAYQHGYLYSSIAQVEKALDEVCDPKKEDCAAFEEDLQV
jgi:ABC-type Fe3+ transport system permease subunit